MDPPKEDLLVAALGHQATEQNKNAASWKNGGPQGAEPCRPGKIVVPKFRQGFLPFAPQVLQKVLENELG